MLFDVLFLILIAAGVPVVAVTGFVLGKFTPDARQKAAAAFAVAMIVLETARFFVNAALYDGAVTPRTDLKFNIVTVLTILAPFAVFCKRHAAALRSTFALLLCAPVVFAVMRPECYINPLDENGVIKAAYDLQIGCAITLGVLFLLQQRAAIGAMNTVWACLALLLYAGLDALTIWYWEWDIAFDITWYLTHLISLAGVGVLYGVYALLRRLLARPQPKPRS